MRYTNNTQKKRRQTRTHFRKLFNLKLISQIRKICFIYHEITFYLKPLTCKTRYHFKDLFLVNYALGDSGTYTKFTRCCITKRNAPLDAVKTNLEKKCVPFPRE